MTNVDQIRHRISTVRCRAARKPKQTLTGWPADAVERREVDRLTPYARNARTHSDEQVAQIAASIKEWGWTIPVLVDEGDGIIAGHGRVLAARKLGIADVPVLVARGWSEAQKRAYVLADNKLTLNGGWDNELLKVELEELGALGFDRGLTGFGTDEIAGLTLANAGLTDPDEVPPMPEIPVSALGDVWVLGRHRLLCGDSTAGEQVARLLNGETLDLTLTDPPYCSGGFQESNKNSGSVGTSAVHKMIANDTLSTRGYMALLKTAFNNFGAPFLYAFTDWRMWLYLFDLAESSGYGARSMIVWDKGTPGMGRGWRAQHELVLWACKQTPPFDKHAPGQGNVIGAKRTGNHLHTTEKPLEVIEILLHTVPFAKRVGDPFAGSGTTLIACETTNRIAYVVELDRAYCDVIVKRWQNFTGQDATLEGDGRTFNEIAKRRGKAKAA